jgi:hypothetical protein
MVAPDRQEVPMTHRRRSCLIDLSQPFIRREAVASGLIWHGPMEAQRQAVRDIAAGRIPEPEVMPEWAATSLAYFRETGEDPHQWR